ncbi:hypothetical protein OG618_37510 (plasmid) [Kitasatospora sp. NBC_01246]|uniref:hypothetical protein n=1 Tax=Kitasatospora sp. NBC_01246 TaxID=2903570 RepID=UPI002E36BA62|nr:hypothetical protein [Kitasatospora sp. NBC_01246]
MDYEAREAIKRLLRERYDWNGADPVVAMRAVRAAAYPSAYAPLLAEEPEPVPAEDVLAALTLIEDARERLDGLELDLIRAARTRATPWSRIATALGLKTRQSAENRALRLERSMKYASGREVSDERLDRARQRAAAAWCEANAGRIEAAAQGLAAVLAEAWPQLEDDVLAVLAVKGLHDTLAAESPPVTVLADHLQRIGWRLMPSGASEPLAPTGPRAAEATAACSVLLDLLGELMTVRVAVRTAADVEPPKPVAAPLNADGTAR